MRGAGKTHLGRACAAALGATFIDLDEAYEKQHGKIMETVKSEGWPVFRQREVALLQSTLTESPTGCVIACGGGIVETEEGRERLKAHWPVVQACKPIDEIEAYNGANETERAVVGKVMSMNKMELHAVLFQDLHLEKVRACGPEHGRLRRLTDSPTLKRETAGSAD